MSVGDRVKKRRKELNISVDELAKRIGKDRSTVYRYESHEIEDLPLSIVEPLAEALRTTPAYIMGWVTENKNEVVPLAPENVYMRPIYDSAAAGFNVLAQDTIIGYMPTYISSPSEQDKYIWVNVVGDSMSPLIDDGSRVLVRRQESVDSGQIAVVLVDGEEARVKKVKYGDNWIELISINPYYPPTKYENADVQRIRVIGLVKEVSKTLS